MKRKEMASQIELNKDRIAAVFHFQSIPHSAFRPLAMSIPSHLSFLGFFLYFFLYFFCALVVLPPPLVRHFFLWPVKAADPNNRINLSELLWGNETADPFNQWSD